MLPDSIRNALKQSAAEHNLDYIQLLESFFVFYTKQVFKPESLGKLQGRSATVSRMASALAVFLESKGFVVPEEDS